MKYISTETLRYSTLRNTLWMIQNAWTYKKFVLFITVVMAAITVSSNLVQLYIAPVILQKVETSAPLAQLLTTIIGFSLLVMLLAGLQNYLTENTVFSRNSLRMRIVRQLMWKRQTTSFPNIEDSKKLSLFDKARQAIDSNSAPSEAIWETLTKLLGNIAGFIIYLCLLSTFSPVLLGVILLTTVAGFFVTRKINQWGYRHRDEEAAYLQKMNYIWLKSSQRDLGKDVRIFGMFPWMQDVYESARSLFEGFVARREMVYIRADILDVVLSFARNGIAYLYLIGRTLEQGLPASEFLLYFSAVGGFTTWVTGILSEMSTLHLQCMELSTIRECLDLPEPFRFEDGEPLEAKPGFTYELRLHNVRFRYPGAQTDTLHCVNLTIHPGEKLAVVGLNGAGKTTLVKLLCGFYDPTEGEVLLNGVDIRQYNRKDYYQLFTAVFQQFSVLETTLAENVTQVFENSEAQLSKAEECIRKAGLSQKLDSLPDGLQTHIGKEVFEDGIELSGGEMQRLMLARALYKGAPIMILDEPTAALDPIAENDLYLKYSDMTSGCTSVYISHRLASTRFCDRIILMADGQIAEEGTHDSLMALNGKYAELYAIQSKYYNEKGSESDEG